MSKLSLENISKRYDDGTLAVSHVTLQVDDGEFLVLVGPSGCGKSTLLRLIAGLESPSTGRIVIDQTTVNDVAPKDRDIAMVFQNYALYPHMSVYDNMAFGLKMRGHGADEIRQRVEQAAATLGLSALLRKKPRALSGGQLQRVALGRAIVRKPRLFLFDEPLSNLDAKLRLSMRSELKKLHKGLQATMVYVTHDQTEAMSLGGRLVVLREGVVQQVGTPLSIYENSANIFVADFLGSPAMNFIHCRLRERGGEYLLENDDFLPIRLSARHAEAIKGAKTIGTEIVAGIRPEHLLLSPSAIAAEKSRALKLQVEIIEPLGSEVLAVCRGQGCELTARLEAAASLQPDQACELFFDIERLQLFDSESGKALLGGANS